MRAVPALLATLILTAGIAGCGKQQASKRDPVAEHSAAQKVQEALAAQRLEEEQHRATVRAAATEGKLASVNTVCPVTGEPVDPAIAPVTVEVLVFNPPEILAIGVATEAAAESVRRFPDRYAPAAKQNRQARSTTAIGR